MSDRFSNKAKYDDICVKCGHTIKGYMPLGGKSQITNADSVAWSRGARADGLTSARWHVTCADLADNADAVARVRDRQQRYAQKMGHATATTATVPTEPKTATIPTEPKTEAVKVAATATTTAANGDFLGGLAIALAPYLEGKLKTQASELSAELEAKIQAAVSTASKVIVVKNEITGEVKNVGRQHEEFEKLIMLLQLGENVYLWGSPGSGKSTALINAAEALGMKHGYISLSAQTAESRVLGYMDANGNYVATEFYRCYTEGGVFVIDEMDNASANLLTALNSALENGTAAFPCGNRPKHKSFMLGATGNTAGYGANPMFPERRPMDAAFRGRFVFVPWGYDESLERDLALGNNPDSGKWIDWIQSVRKFTSANYPKLVVSPRECLKGAKLLLKFKPADAAEMALFKGFDKDSVNRILAANPLPRM